MDLVQVPREHDLDAHLNKFSRSLHQVWMFDYDRTIGPAVFLPMVTATTDADGRFTLSGFGDDRLVDLIISGPGRVETRLTVMTRAASAIILDRDLRGFPQRAIFGANFSARIEAGWTLRGVVRDRATHQPIAGMLVGRRQSVPTDAEGRFTIDGIDPVWLPLEERRGPDGIHHRRHPPTRDALHPGLAGGFPDRRRDPGMPAGHPVPTPGRRRGGSPGRCHRVVLSDHPEPVPGRPGPPLANRLRPARDRRDPPGPGTYEGFVIPGPGAVLVKTKSPDFRAAHVDPKAFFAPGKTDWTTEDRFTVYGSEDSLSAHGGTVVQAEYAAITLINPSADAGPLTLEATVRHDEPRAIKLVDPEGQPVTGASATRSMTINAAPATLRTDTYWLRCQPINHDQRLTFVHKDRKLIGFLMARVGDHGPATVTLRPWATLTGRLLDENDQPLASSGELGNPRQRVWLGDPSTFSWHDLDDPDFGDIHEKGIVVDVRGRFRLDHLIPGQRYTAEVYRPVGLDAGPAFENIVLEAGENRDLGDIPTRQPVPVKGR